jgi:hypothetical protein
VEADLVGDGAFRQLPDLLGVLAMLGVGHHHVGRQAVGKGADFARRAAGRRLAGQRERAVARLGDLAGQQVDVVDHVVHPGAAGVLVEAHGPEADDLLLRVGIQLGQLLEALGRHAGQLGHLLERVFGDELLELVEGDRPRTCRLSPLGLPSAPG